MNIAVLGAGAMGRVLAQMIDEREGMGLAAMVEPQNGETLDQIADNVDVVIDFSNPNNLDMLLDYCRNQSYPAVIATTGFTEEQQRRIGELSAHVPVVFAANYSLGITIMKRLLQEITPILENTFDMEMIEKHHNKKLDAPSGTAKMLVKAMNPAGVYDEVNGRDGNRKRSKEIGIHAVRGGTIAGEHTAIYVGEDEILEISHTTGSKKVFAAGALKAAAFAVSAQTGLYDMEEVLFGKRE